MTYTIAVCAVKSSDDGQRNCPKHEFYSKDKLEKLVLLVGFIIRVTGQNIQHDNNIICTVNCNDKRAVTPDTLGTCK